jgi:hypothetical protein
VHGGHRGSAAGRRADLTGVRRELSEAVRHRAATSLLTGLMSHLGEAGLGVAGRSAGLLADLDQHAASVRDALGDPQDGPNAVSLAGYATGVRDALVDADWDLPDEIDWSAPQWPTVRLLAVCSLARTNGYA